MTHLRKRIKISWLWLPYVLFLPFLPIAKVILYIFMILSLHEMAHILCAIIFHYPVEKVMVYPFGLSAAIAYIGYGNLIKETIIICAGPFMHVLLPYLFHILYNVGWISAPFLAYLNMMNASILIFNLLPIYPLDGGRLLQVFFGSLLRFQTANKATIFCSIGVILWLYSSHLLAGFSGTLVLLFLFLQNIETYRKLPMIRQSFHHYRMHHPVSYDIIMNEKQDLYRGRYNMLHRKQGWMREQDWLRMHFPEDVEKPKEKRQS